MCSLRGTCIATIALLMSVLFLTLAYIAYIRASQGNSFSPFPWWPSSIKHPVVFFPGYSTSRLKVRCCRLPAQLHGCAIEEHDFLGCGSLKHSRRPREVREGEGQQGGLREERE